MLDVATRLDDAAVPAAEFSMSVDAPNDSANLAYSMLWSFGGQEVDESGERVVLDSAGTRKALEYYYELVHVSDARALGYDEGGNNAAFLASEIAMTQNASSILWKARQDQSELADDINHVKYPTGPNGYHQLVEMNSMAIFSHSRNVDAGMDWLRYSVAADKLRDRAEVSLSYYSPPLVDFLDDPAMPWNTNPMMAGMRGVFEGGHMPGWPGPASRESGIVYDNSTIVRMFRSVAEGIPVSEAVKTASEELRLVYET